MWLFIKQLNMEYSIAVQYLTFNLKIFQNVNKYTYTYTLLSLQQTADLVVQCRWQFASYIERGCVNGLV